MKAEGYDFKPHLYVRIIRLDGGPSLPPERLSSPQPHHRFANLTLFDLFKQNIATMSAQQTSFIAKNTQNSSENEHNGPLLSFANQRSEHGNTGYMNYGLGHQAPPVMTQSTYSEVLKSPFVHPGVHGISSNRTMSNLATNAPSWNPINASGVVPGPGNDDLPVLDFEGSEDLDDFTSTQVNELDWTPPFNNCSLGTFASTEPDENQPEVPSKGKGPLVEVNVMGSYNVKLTYLMYTQKGVNPLKMSVQKLNKGVGKWIAYRIDPTTKIIDIDDNSFIALKNILFTAADSIDQDAPAGGNSAIFKLADASGSVTITLTGDNDVQAFFTAVQLAPLKEAGISILMADPAKSAKAADAKIDMAQTRLKAMNAMNNVTVSDSQLTDSLPHDPLQLKLEALIKKYGSLENNSREGWRVYKPHEASKYMQMNYEHLHKWAQELAECQAGVNLENPPMYLEGFKWTDVKRPLSTAAPQHSAKKNKCSSDAGPPHAPGGYSELQGYHIAVNREELEELKKHCNLEEFLNYAGIPPFFVRELAKILWDHHIDSFDQFLFPDIMNIRDVLGLGISWGMVMKLFAQSRLFYKQLKKEIITCDQISAREGPYNFPKSTVAPGASGSVHSSAQAGPSRLPYTPAQGGSNQSSNL
ncbi:uncharacterized protein MELLADRAFT_95802 [Melampsora larici-populina 98AG31]|uniref:Uncharacterized protein n=1 Tax=Melampsora larici-populina (strain 98AG31 / pathotype 3-4-7) TaxID=747676 RepID=F4RD98_MELLP|nr:uncharacterized protein MELLADRAFT_95802 [Melampsora larici-populina 98AG31]EGG09363.1 hypothetical protein MELLADRAFT_95802 [Melampsora larici-populina 98AG31]